MRLSKFARKLLGKWVLIPFFQNYLSQERKVKVGDMSLKVPVGVFHPTLFLSTKFLLEYIKIQEFKDKKMLELGAGSGLLSIEMAKRGATVMASDISLKACQAVQENALQNGVVIEIIHSDLFADFEKKTFDFILINPPYYPKNPETEADQAWFCGENFEYFQKLFHQLRHFLANNGKAIMVLSEDCDILKISQLAAQFGYLWKQVAQKKSWGEWNYLFEITI
ncbi:MAG: HemK2/MTQ2 family protein methyltransferase [Runella sp.]|jgi:release factor glutamine methyltransferase|uniref:HemK2/MTQ2 family protein methyltransferase n=1 Tax=Runella sp. TaxID=1960881 RepID=UPI002633A3B7|nr:HemK2/MTQ2 family protein methyltransferase [Runella sp.]